MTARFSINPKWRVGVVTARFNSEVTSMLTEGAMKQLKDLGFKAQQIEVVTVPGAFEIPLAAKWLVQKKCDGVIVLGAVIRGETSHYDYVCSAVERGCTQLQLESAKPIVFGVLTTDNEEQAFNRVGGTAGHKGIEAALVLTEMLSLKNTIFKTKKTIPKPPKKESQSDRRKSTYR